MNATLIGVLLVVALTALAATAATIKRRTQPARVAARVTVDRDASRQDEPRNEPRA
jgi:hypothetical protein